MKKLLFSVLLFLAFSLPAHALFYDVDDLHPNYKAITWMEENDIVEGYFGDIFKPDDPVNRAEFLKMLYLTKNQENWMAVNQVGNHIFWDLPAESYWYQLYLSEAVFDGVIDGYPDGSFRPEQTINFAEAAKIIAISMFDYDGKDSSHIVPDYDTCLAHPIENSDQWFYNFVVTLDLKCIFPPSLREFGEDYPAQEVTRADMAEMLYRARTAIDHAEELSPSGYGDQLEPDRLLEPNQFAFRTLKFANSVLDWTVVDRAPSSSLQDMSKENFSIRYKGNVELSGNIFWDGFWVCMNLDQESKMKLPILANDDRYLEFCFYEYNDELFYPKGSFGPATVVLNMFEYHIFDDEDAFGFPRYYGDVSEIIHYDYLDLTYAPELCEVDPGNDGFVNYPINPKYDFLTYLGQLFTADDCGGERIENIYGVEGDQYVAGSKLNLQTRDQDMVALLNEIGFECENPGIEDIYCFNWILDHEVPLDEILRLKEVYYKLFSDDCAICG